MVYNNIVCGVIVFKIEGYKYIYKDDKLIKTSNDMILDITDLDNGVYTIRCNGEETKIQVKNG